MLHARGAGLARDTRDLTDRYYPEHRAAGTPVTILTIVWAFAANVMLVSLGFLSNLITQIINLLDRVEGPERRLA